MEHNVSERVSRNSTFFQRFLRAYILVLGVPIVFGAIAYRTAFKAVEAQAIDTHMAILRQIEGILARGLREVERIALEVIENPKVRRFSFIDEPFEGANA